MQGARLFGTVGTEIREIAVLSSAQDRGLRDEALQDGRQEALKKATMGCPGMLKELRGATERKWPYVRKCRGSTIGVDLFIWLHQEIMNFFKDVVWLFRWTRLQGRNQDAVGAG